MSDDVMESLNAKLNDLWEEAHSDTASDAYRHVIEVIFEWTRPVSREEMFRVTDAIENSHIGSANSLMGTKKQLEIVREYGPSTSSNGGGGGCLGWAAAFFFGAS